MNKRVIWKYTMVQPRESFEMPAGAEVLTAQMQGRALQQIVLWAIVDPDQPKTPRHFVVIGTGHDIQPDPLRYVATVQHGPVVWHVFERLWDA